MSQDRDYLLDIRDVIAGLRGHSPASGFIAGLTEYPDFGEMAYHRVFAGLSSIVEAVDGLSASFKDRHPEVAWASLASIRQVLDRWPPIQPNIVWRMLQGDLARLADAIPALLDDTRD